MLIRHVDESTESIYSKEITKSTESTKSIESTKSTESTNILMRHFDKTF